MKNNKGRGGEGGEEKTGLKERGGLLEGGEGLNRGFTVWVAQGKWILLTGNWV